MIGYLEGVVLKTNESSLLLNVGGVGYKVNTPLPTLMSLSKDDTVSLYVHTHVREDNISLFGFTQEEELFLFEKLTSVSGIGPKSALAMISVHSPSSVALAVENGDAASLSHTPGIGKRTAEKIILELKGKLSHLVGESLGNSNSQEARMALEALGYSSKEIHEALKNINPEGSTSSIIKEALQKLQ